MPRRKPVTDEDLNVQLSEQDLNDCYDTDIEQDKDVKNESNKNPSGTNTLHSVSVVRDLGPNPYKNIIHLARAFDAWRPFPRLFITVYIYLVYEVVRWAMFQDALTLEQSGLVSVVVGAGAAWFGLYVGSGKGPNE